MATGQGVFNAGDTMPMGAVKLNADRLFNLARIEIPSGLADFAVDNLTVTTIPKLTVAHTTTNTAVLSWPAPTPGFVLQENSTAGNNLLGRVNKPRHQGRRLLSGYRASQQRRAVLPAAASVKFLFKQRIRKPVGINSMKTSPHVSFAAAAAAAASCICAPVADAATVQTFGTGSAVSVVDRVAVFDSLTSTNTMELGNYTEDGLSITTGSQAWGADPPYMLAALHPFGGVGEPNLAFFGMANGTAESVVIETANHSRMYGVEFMYGNTWSVNGTSWGNDQGFVEWQTLKNGAVVSSGQVRPNLSCP
jgi:hypothetical protein